MIALPHGTAAIFCTRSPHNDTPNEDGAVLIRVDESRSILAVADGMGREPGGAHPSGGGEGLATGLATSWYAAPVMERPTPTSWPVIRHPFVWSAFWPGEALVPSGSLGTWPCRCLMTHHACPMAWTWLAWPWEVSPG